MRTRLSGRAKLLLLATAVVLAGCPTADPFPDLYPLSGTITRDGKPVTAGGLILLPDPGNGSGLVVNANVNADGTFTVETSWTKPTGGIVSKSGAPAGRYKAVYHPPSNGARTGLEVELSQPVTVEAKENTASFALPLVMPAGNGVPRDDDPDSPKFNPSRKD